MTHCTTVFYIVVMAIKKSKPKEQLTVGLHIRIPETLYDEILNLATAEDRTASNMVRVLLEIGLTHRKGRK